MEQLSLTGKRWHSGADLRTHTTADAMVAHLLQQRGVAGFEESIDAATCGYGAALFPDCAHAIERIQAAIHAHERIAVFGDYDCDGITSTALLARFFERRGIRPFLRLPHRQHEGYGLKENIMREMAATSVTLLITVDTGVTAAREIALARERGIDVIVLDHHHLPEELPEAYAILHPALAPGFPEPHPSAAGVAWSLVRALETADGNAQWDEQDTDLALAAIGTIADLVELRGGNRTLATAGVRALQRIGTGSLALLKMQAGLTTDPLTSRDIAFRIAPRINAAGRMAEPDIALRALLGDHASLVRLDELNLDRQGLVSRLMEQALPLVDPSAPFIALQHSSYIPGVCGLLAGKLTEKFGRPSLVAHKNGNMCTASLRSIAAYNVTEGLGRVADLLTSFGGHAMAAGCSFPAKNFDALAARFRTDVTERTTPDDLIPSLRPDAHVQSTHLTLALCNALQQLEPHGQGNPEPSFVLTNVMIDRPRRIGADGNHLQGSINGKKLVAFRMGTFLEDAAKPVDLVCRIGIDTWQGKKQVQLFVEDMRASRTAPMAAGISGTEQRRN